jgi:UDP-2,3-diacylglucosamine pyrophosphatase LpxH
MFTYRHASAVLVTFVAMLSASCASAQSERATAKFGHTVKATESQPWTDLNFLNDPRDFTFAIVSDLTGGERSGIFDVAVADLNLLAPEFVMSVGDLIEGYTTDQAELKRQWDSFDAKVDSLDMPFFYAAGNHDFSNPEMRELWKKRLGRDYYHFVYKDALFLVLNSEDWNMEQFASISRNMVERREFLGTQEYWEKTLAGFITGFISDEQAAYFEKAIADKKNVRWTFLFMHTPMWQGEGSKEYWKIESALKGRPFTAFAGHVHQYKKSMVNDQVHIRLGTTGGVFLEERQVPGAKYDHVTLVSVVGDKPRIVNLKLEGILNQDGEIPAGGDKLKMSTPK